jgi:hypothetical protein
VAKYLSDLMEDDKPEIEVEVSDDSGEESLADLAKEAGVSDPVALVKLIKAIVRECM